VLGTFSALAACIDPYWVFPMLGEAPIGSPPKSPVGRLNWSGLSATAPRWGRFFWGCLPNIESATAIDALIDEATGHQKRRAHDALQRLLAAYVRPEFRTYEEILKLQQ
jgi:hypothetical protein